MFNLVKNHDGNYEFKFVPDGSDTYTYTNRADSEIVNTITSRGGILITEDPSVITTKADSPKPAVGPFEIKAVQSNRAKNVFTVAWMDGTVTSVHCQPGDDWDDEKALAMCFTKKALGNKGNFNDKFNDTLANMKVIPVPEKKVTPAAPVADKPTIDSKWRVVDRPVKVGDHIRLVTAWFTFNTIGDILPVDVMYNGIVGVKAENHPCDTMASKDYIWWYTSNGYEVVEPIKKDNDATGAMADALTRLTENAHETAKSLGKALAKKLEKSNIAEKINELCASTSPAKKEAAQCTKDPDRRYKVYLYGIFTESNELLFSAKTIEAVRQFVSDDSKARGHGFYSRLWGGNENDLYIDYGSHTHYYHITGANLQEYAYN